MDPSAQVRLLLDSAEPSVRYKVRVGVLGENAASRSIRSLREEIRGSPRVHALLAGCALARRRGVYQKWKGAHWALVALADLGYPTGDRALFPLRDEVLDEWLSPTYYDEYECASKAKAYARRGVPIMQGRARRDADAATRSRSRSCLARTW